MKRILILTIGIAITSCNQHVETNETDHPAAESFDWLNGHWKRLNDQDQHETFENWTKISPAEYSGIGFTLQKGDTISQEQMQLIESDGKWSLFVKTPDEKEPIEFKIKEVKNNAFVCTNDSIEFPKRIHYWIENKNLKAKVSNETMEIPFEFEKVN